MSAPGEFGEPWTAGETGQPGVNCADAPSRLSVQEARRRYLRAVDCVNACDGLDIPLDVPHGWIAQQMGAKRINDALSNELHAWLEENEPAVLARAMDALAGEVRT